MAVYGCQSCRLVTETLGPANGASLLALCCAECGGSLEILDGDAPYLSPSLVAPDVALDLAIADRAPIGDLLEQITRAQVRQGDQDQYGDQWREHSRQHKPPETGTSPRLRNSADDAGKH